MESLNSSQKCCIVNIAYSCVYSVFDNNKDYYKSLWPL